MEPKKSTTLIINIAIGALIVAVLYVGYFSFKKDGKLEEPSQEATVNLGTQAILTSQQVTQTFKEFDNLKRSVANSIAVFSLPAFQELKDYSIEVFPEPVGRENPFSQTGWKAQMDATIK